MVERLNPLNDVVFKRLFGENHDKKLLIGLLNAILHTDIVDIQIQEEKLAIDKIDDKQGYLDIKAKCKNGTQIDIEVQLRDQKNMIKRTLFYWGKLYTENLMKSIDYTHLQKTIIINILGFNLLHDASYHSRNRIFDMDRKEQTTDLLEIHFIQYPKFKNMHKDLNNPMHRWLLFLQEDISEQQLEAITCMDPLIEYADEKLHFLSADEEVRRMVELREKGEADRKAQLQLATEKGRMEEKMETARKLFNIGLSIEQISEVTGLAVDDLRPLLH